MMKAQCMWCSSQAIASMSMRSLPVILIHGSRPKSANQQGLDIRNYTDDGQSDASRASYPAEGVTWDEATQYCQAQQKTLPTEAQWEKGVKGGCELGTDSKTATKKTYALTHGDLKPQPVPSPTTNCRPAKCLNCATQIPFRSISHTKERVLTAMHTSAEMSGNMFETSGTPRPMTHLQGLIPAGLGLATFTP